LVTVWEYSWQYLPPSKPHHMATSFEFQGVTITDPNMDETGRFRVYPHEYYGDAYQEDIEGFQYRENFDSLDDAFRYWVDSDNVVKTKEGYRAQCGLYIVAYTKENLLHYFISQGYGDQWASPMR